MCLFNIFLSTKEHLSYDIIWYNEVLEAFENLLFELSDLNRPQFSESLLVLLYKGLESNIKNCSQLIQANNEKYIFFDYKSYNNRKALKSKNSI